MTQDPHLPKNLFGERVRPQTTDLSIYEIAPGSVLKPSCRARFPSPLLVYCLLFLSNLPFIPGFSQANSSFLVLGQKSEA